MGTHASFPHTATISHPAPVLVALSILILHAHRSVTLSYLSLPTRNHLELEPPDARFSLIHDPVFEASGFVRPSPEALENHRSRSRELNPCVDHTRRCRVARVTFSCHCNHGRSTDGDLFVTLCGLIKSRCTASQLTSYRDTTTLAKDT
jgi:hypothetical protein